MPPLFPYQAVILQPQGGRLGGYVPQSAAPPYNEILDSLLTGYLWGCLLVALFLIIYFAISFCVWAIGSALTFIDMAIDYLQLRGSCPDAGTDTVMAASALSGRYNTAYLERITPPSEHDIQTWPRGKSDEDLWDVTSHTERNTLPEENGVKDCPDRRQRIELIRQPIHHPPFDSKNTNAVETFLHNVYDLNLSDQFAIAIQH